MPTMLPTGGLYRECSTSVIEEDARMTQALTGEVVDVAKEQQECIRRVLETAQHSLQAARDQQAYDQLVFYIIIAVTIALLALTFIYRKPIRTALESIFIGVTAKTISTKKDLKAYREDIAERVRERTER